MSGRGGWRGKKRISREGRGEPSDTYVFQLTAFVHIRPDLCTGPFIHFIGESIQFS